MKIAGIIFLLFVSLSGMAQQAESSKEYVIKAWNEFQLPEKGAIKAILAQRDQITRYLKVNNAAVEAEQENVCLLYTSFLLDLLLFVQIILHGVCL